MRHYNDSTFLITDLLIIFVSSTMYNTYIFICVTYVHIYVHLYIHTYVQFNSTISILDSANGRLVTINLNILK